MILFENQRVYEIPRQDRNLLQLLAAQDIMSTPESDEKL